MTNIRISARRRNLTCFALTADRHINPWEPPGKSAGHPDCGRKSAHCFHRFRKAASLYLGIGPQSNCFLVDVQPGNALRTAMLQVVVYWMERDNPGSHCIIVKNAAALWTDPAVQKVSRYARRAICKTDIQVSNLKAYQEQWSAVDRKHPARTNKRLSELPLYLLEIWPGERTVDQIRTGHGLIRRQRHLTPTLQYRNTSPQIKHFVLVICSGRGLHGKGRFGITTPARSYVKGMMRHVEDAGYNGTIASC
jgi:hypothetical protein